MRNFRSFSLFLALLFITGDSKGFAEVVGTLGEEAKVDAPATVAMATGATETEAVLGDKDLLIQATAEFVSKVGELRTELELLRLSLGAETQGTKSACLACEVKPEWRMLPLGALAPLKVDKAICEKSSDSCMDAKAFRQRAFGALSRRLGGLERMSCDYLLKQVGEQEACPAVIGEFYNCSDLCE